MKIGLLPVDSHNGFPNLALMKLSAYHKQKGDDVGWYDIFGGIYDIVYKSKVFSFTPDYEYYINTNQLYRGGTGYDMKELIPEIDNCLCDYSIYPQLKEAYGFLTRGCIRNCPWCIVPKKEGKIRPYADIEDILQGRKQAILIDNNILAIDYGLSQIEKIIDLGIKVDFNQGLDARLVTSEIAKTLSKIKWIRYIRFSCDTMASVDPLLRAIEKLNKFGVSNYRIFVYVLVKEIDDANERCKILKKLGVSPFAQPYIDIDFDNKIMPTIEQKRFARYVNHKAIFNSIMFEDYKF